jgi:hypothetical protein
VVPKWKTSFSRQNSMKHAWAAKQFVSFNLFDTCGSQFLEKQRHIAPQQFHIIKLFLFLLNVITLVSFMTIYYLSVFIVTLGTGNFIYGSVVTIGACRRSHIDCLKRKPSRILKKQNRGMRGGTYHVVTIKNQPSPVVSASAPSLVQVVPLLSCSST